MRCWGAGEVESPCMSLQRSVLLCIENNCTKDAALLKEKRNIQKKKVPNISSLNCNKITDENK